MQQVIINRQLDKFYCPLTGNQILFEDDFVPSPAMIYCYLDDEEVFAYIKESMMYLLKMMRMIIFAIGINIKTS